MERKIQNSQFQRTCSQIEKINNNNNKKERRRSRSVHPYLRNTTKRVVTDYLKHEVKSCYQTRASEPIRSKEQSSDVQASEDSCMKRTSCLGYGKAQKIKVNYSSGTSTPRNVEKVKNSEETLKAELSRCKKELDDYNNATKELEQKYMQINIELGEMQQRHGRFLANETGCSPTCSDFSIKHKHTQIFERGKSIIMLLGDHDKEEPQVLETYADGQICSSQHNLSEQTYTNHNCHNKQQTSADDDSYGCKHLQFKNQNQARLKTKEHLSTKFQGQQYSKDSVTCLTPKSTSSDIFSQKNADLSNPANLNRIYETLQQAINSEQKTVGQPTNGLIPDNIKQLQRTIAELQNEQRHFCNVIQQQQTYLQDYQDRCIKAKRIMNAQKSEIEKLMRSKKDLKDDVEKRLDKVRHQLDEKLREMAPISQQLRETQARYEKVVKDSRVQAERIRILKAQSKEFKDKLEDLTKRKTAIMTKLKNAERDLRVYKNYNTALKTEKQRQSEEMQKIREQLTAQQAISKRVLSRQRDNNDKHCRDLQRRIYELEQKLGRSNNSTSGLLQQRDRLISELQAQINSLVHNFEISQKHIRVLRRQIVNAAGNVVGITPSQRKNT